MLTLRYHPRAIQELLLPPGEWEPFPACAARARWERIEKSLREKRIGEAETALAQTWPVLPATLYLEFARNGNRSRFENAYFERRDILCRLAIGECLELGGRFSDAIANALWSICEESTWVFPAHCFLQNADTGLADTGEPVVDLFAGETSACLSWVVYLLEAQLAEVSPRIVDRIRREIRQRIFEPLLNREDFDWMGFVKQRVNNWNPWIVSNWLSSALILETDPTLRVRHVYKAMRVLDNFIDRHPQDGGCDEGPSYWLRGCAALLDALEWLFVASAGKIQVFDQPLIKEIARYIYRVQLADHYFLNFADASALFAPPPALCHRIGLRISDEKMQALGAWAAGQAGLGSSEVRGALGRQLSEIFGMQEVRGTVATAPLPRDVFLSEIEVFLARDKDGSSEGFCLGAKGGHNDENHNHNDVGNYILYVDGKPVLVDAGVGTYTKQTFGRERYSIWTMRSCYHSLPTVNGVEQAAGAAFGAHSVTCHCDDSCATFQLDLSGAYPAHAGLKSWMRCLQLIRGKEVVISEKFSFMHRSGETWINLLTACNVKEVQNGVLELRARPLADGRTSGAVTLYYAAESCTVVIETIPIQDENLCAVWGDSLCLIRFVLNNEDLQGHWVMCITR